ncbi:MAG: EAL domain-containing protein [Gammaproteobacteria bacterium]|nr:EAL domain-containing protein [Gammaproteobacteria bacterium]
MNNFFEQAMCQALGDRISCEIFRVSQIAMMLVDRRMSIVAVNPAFTRTTGYDFYEVMGENPRKLSSGIHDRLFYETLWQSLLDQGSWSGEIWNRRKNGEIYPEHLRIDAIRNAQGEVTHYVGMFTDITNEKGMQKRLQNLAFHDTLTGLPNRAYLKQRVNELLGEVNSGSALLFVDIDNFKRVNDELGHSFGDEILRIVANRLQAAVRQSDVVCRLGGDEFVIVLPDLTDVARTEAIAGKILTQLQSPITSGDHEIGLTASIGISFYPKDGEDFESLFQYADVALYDAKGMGKNGYSLYRREMSTTFRNRLALEKDLRLAIEGGLIDVFYQPKLNLVRGRVSGFEALARWHHPEHGWIGPNVFIPIAEDAGMIDSLAEHVIRRAVRQVRDWSLQARFPYEVAVNISSKQFRTGGVVHLMQDIVNVEGFPPEQVEIEVTESQLMENSRQSQTIIEALKSLGMHIAIDDFGTGYSSLGYLKQFHVDRLKIDKVFVQDIGTPGNDEELCDVILSIGNTLGIKVTAEGVEKREQFDFFSQRRCDELQGYYIARPLPWDQFGPDGSFNTGVQQ